MKTETHRLFFFAENCVQKGRHVGTITGEQIAEFDAETDPDREREVYGILAPIGDCETREGTKSELVEDARADLARVPWVGPHRSKIARAVLEHFGAPAVEEGEGDDESC